MYVCSCSGQRSQLKAMIHHRHVAINGLQGICTSYSYVTVLARTSHVHTKTEIQLIGPGYSYTQ